MARPEISAKPQRLSKITLSALGIKREGRYSDDKGTLYRLEGQINSWLGQIERQRQFSTVEGEEHYRRNSHTIKIARAELRALRAWIKKRLRKIDRKHYRPPVAWFDQWYRWQDRKERPGRRSGADRVNEIWDLHLQGKRYAEILRIVFGIGQSPYPGWAREAYVRAMKESRLRFLKSPDLSDKLSIHVKTCAKCSRFRDALLNLLDQQSHDRSRALERVANEYAKTCKPRKRVTHWKPSLRRPERLPRLVNPLD
ncbi:MAG: hypothetical protein A2992_06805 [Elusimicrobia bacterium RIFCSPLOWO2_01_FULL_59_12]|nr:MAG: hypothetical protein A2992_06805 [Elusimicrobia bacterium RIFCSPLOWO2_01_FULL_59_12]